MKIIDAEFRVISGADEGPSEKPRFDYRWIFWGLRIGLGLLALGGVIAAEVSR